jgi:hypothetical protein
MTPYAFADSRILLLGPTRIPNVRPPVIHIWQITICVWLNQSEDKSAGNLWQ